MDLVFDPAKLRAARQRASLSQIELAKEIAGARDPRWLKDSLNSWERGRQVPSPANVRSLAEALDIAPGELLSEKAGGK